MSVEIFIKILVDIHCVLIGVIIKTTKKLVSIPHVVAKWPFHFFFLFRFDFIVFYIFISIFFLYPTFLTFSFFFYLCWFLLIIFFVKSNGLCQTLFFVDKFFLHLHSFFLHPHTFKSIEIVILKSINVKFENFLNYTIQIYNLKYKKLFYYEFTI